jgi:hypothetical protein
MSTPMTISSWPLTQPPPAVLDFILQAINIADKPHDNVMVQGSSAWQCDHGGMATRKRPATGRTGASVAEFLGQIPDPNRREDARRLCAVMEEITGEPPAMWGTSIIGFGTYHYRYASGQEGDSALASFSPRRAHLAIYLIGGFENRYQRVLARLGPYKAGKGCLYIKHLDDVDPEALRELINRSVQVRKGVARATTSPDLGSYRHGDPAMGCR